MILTLLLIGLFSIQSLAKSVADYRKDVQTAQYSAEELNYYLDDLAEELTEEDAKYEKELFDEIRKNVPATDKIEFQGISIETQNQWLNEKLDAYLKEPKNSANKLIILTEISERLESLDSKLKELENPSNSVRSKDEDKQKLAEILRREEFQKPQKKEKEPSIFEKWLTEFIQWLAGIFPKANLPTGDGSGLSSLSFVLQIVVFAVVISIIGFLLYKFAPFISSRFRRREKREKKDRVILGEKIMADESSENLFSEAELLAREGNLRGAIRKGYIALLCELSDRRVIGLADHKTNRDYLRDVRKKDDIYENMCGMTNSFEKHWYGFESVAEEDWSEFRQKYQQTVSGK